MCNYFETTVVYTVVLKTTEFNFRYPDTYVIGFAKSGLVSIQFQVSLFTAIRQIQ